VGLEKFAASFVSAEVDGDGLALIDDETLNEMGINKKLDRGRIMMKIKKLRS